MKRFLWKASFAAVGLATLFSPLASSASQLTQDQINSIIGLLQAFGADASVVANVQASLTGNNGNHYGQWCHTFNTNISAGSSGSEADALAESLKRENTSSVIAFQEKYKDEILTPSGLSNGTGYVGPATRKKLNQLYGCGVIIPSPTPTALPAPVSAKPRLGPFSSGFFVQNYSKDPRIGGIILGGSDLNFTITGGTVQSYTILPPYSGYTTPTVTNLITVTAGENFTLSWNTSEKSCMATGDWHGIKESSGTETIVAPEYPRFYYYEMYCFDVRVGEAPTLMGRRPTWPIDVHKAIAEVITVAVTGDDKKVPTMKLIYPKGGETFKLGQEIVIRWDGQGMKNVTLELEQKNLHYSWIASAAPNTGSYEWAIPNLEAFTVVNNNGVYELTPAEPIKLTPGKYYLSVYNSGARNYQNNIDNSYYFVNDTTSIPITIE
jgi:hypothetical protein